MAGKPGLSGIQKKSPKKAAFLSSANNNNKSRLKSLGIAHDKNAKKKASLLRSQVRKQELIEKELELKVAESKRVKRDKKTKKDGGVRKLPALQLGSLVETLNQVHDEINDTAKQQEKQRRMLPSGKTQKSRRLLVDSQTKQLQMVLNHQAFQKNPLAALQEHLLNTVAPAEIVKSIPEPPKKSEHAGDEETKSKGGKNTKISKEHKRQAIAAIAMELLKTAMQKKEPEMNKRNGDELVVDDEVREEQEDKETAENKKTQAKPTPKSRSTSLPFDNQEISLALRALRKEQSYKGERKIRNKEKRIKGALASRPTASITKKGVIGVPRPKI